MTVVKEQAAIAVTVAPGFQIKNGVIACGSGVGLKNMLDSGRQWLEAHAVIVNNLNVYPVPDGDTGTNMVLTMRAALAQMAQAPHHNVSTTAQNVSTTAQNVSAIAHAAAQGALLGARGNSGVILSQFLHGLAQGLPERESFTAADFARAAQVAAAQAYQSVIEPVEGTILTVARAVSDAALRSAANTTDLTVFFADVLAAAKIAQAGTPAQLPVLKEAGVTDSGGQGLVYLLEGMLRYLQNKPVDVAPAEAEALFVATIGLIHNTYGYDVQFLIRGPGLNVVQIRNQLDLIGGSTLVVGDERLVKVHIHTNDPGRPLSYGAQQGIISDVVVENLDEQARAFAHRSAEAGQTMAGVAIIAVAPGEGLARIFYSLGASRVVAGGQTLNPSVEELLAAIKQTPAENVVILPNNRNVILAARQAQKLAAKNLAEKNVVVLPTHTVPQGIAALLSFNPQAGPAANVELMQKAAQQVQTMEVARVTRPSRFNGFTLKPGDVIGLLDGKLLETGRHEDEVLLNILAQMDMDLGEIVTVYYGQDCSFEQARALADKVLAHYPHLNVEVHAGGQPHYHYIISME